MERQSPLKCIHSMVINQASDGHETVEADGPMKPGIPIKPFAYMKSMRWETIFLQTFFTYKVVNQNQHHQSTGYQIRWF